jgi:putative ABC transport system permease protein
MRQSWIIAWRQLMKEKRRVAAAVAGITFAVLLMLVQLGFEQALFKSVRLLYREFDADLFLVNPRYQNAQFTFAFSERRLEQSLAVDGVQSVDPLYLKMLIWKNPVTGLKQEIFAIAIRPRAGVMTLPEVNRQIAGLRTPDTILFDGWSRDEYGPVDQLLRRGPLSVEIDGITAPVDGEFHMGTSMATNGNIVLSDESLKDLSPGYDLRLLTIGLIKLKPGADAGAVQNRLRALLPDDVAVLTREELMERETSYWATHTPIGFVFRMGLIMGLIVGSVVVYQILYNDVTQHLEEYATLKAMGYPDRFLLQIVLQESLILSMLGFIPGLVFSQAVYSLARWATLLPLQIDLTRVAVVYVLTVGMCIFSGLLATRRLRTADPAEIF